ncbi:MAG: hypothetical protein ACRDY4_00565 [Acidimicrobiia bacterium]
MPAAQPTLRERREAVVREHMESENHEFLRQLGIGNDPVAAPEAH